ncbi:peptide ABC transporter ATP-binding protein [Variovorax sp. Root318D1]|uniref:ABC transporter ATP-binding protein n=1 Tax=Variovorax sp. Root318D1 TaxID=1736513 RepID=UPI0007013AB4|nr:ABC transporter ATP-binding protein [Variovorax sp. Root318D1]KQU91488.1 peptide ABC transporter ATP-binding protein [Variovorax sp. Root318D1]
MNLYEPIRIRDAQSAAEAGNILDVRDLNVSFRTAGGTVHAVRDVSFSVRRGETLALVGETSSGKSVTCLGLLGLTPPAPYCTITGSARLAARDGKTFELVGTPERVMRQVRGGVASVIFQEPMTSLNPVHTVGAQICESLRIHLGMSARAATDRAADLLNQVGISDPKRRLTNYPHELSGGMRQRVMIAMAIACEPSLLIADEPTTALDVTIQAQILELLEKLQSQTRMAMIYITHNLGTVAEIADRVMVKYAGRIVEQADVVPLFTEPRHPYSRGLIHSVPRLHSNRARKTALFAIPGNVPDPAAHPPGCTFGPRCGHFEPGRCDAAVPDLENVTPGHQVRCVRWPELEGAA